MEKGYISKKYQDLNMTSKTNNKSEILGYLQWILVCFWTLCKVISLLIYKSLNHFNYQHIVKQKSTVPGKISKQEIIRLLGKTKCSTILPKAILKRRYQNKETTNEQLGYWRKQSLVWICELIS